MKVPETSTLLPSRPSTASWSTQGTPGATLLTVVTTDELVLAPSLSVTVTVAVYRPLSA